MCVCMNRTAQLMHDEKILLFFSFGFANEAQSNTFFKRKYFNFFFPFGRSPSLVRHRCNSEKLYVRHQIIHTINTNTWYIIFRASGFVVVDLEHILVLAQTSRLSIGGTVHMTYRRERTNSFGVFIVNDAENGSNVNMHVVFEDV